ncbi:baculoviral IAP repeat-containing protein 7-A-like [Ruditapes philippinarum]|uniref:baculoviral IAP repeat-containing protein 7-A-like n=1 Tax=Ruditapes philippinarum TaxID=129788 RepID=UPI00295BBA73|nr:baculoviral IAP repeat-containing protein 7-A-like [Ruditapes philippinarum]
MDTISHVIAPEWGNGKQTYGARGKHMIKGDAMNKEWARFQSYINFPRESVASPLRLANAGFYYSGSGEEVECFCCGLRTGVWTEDETPLDVHQRLSPHCRFICGEETTNVAVNGENRLKSVTNCSKASDLTNDNKRPVTKTVLQQSENNSGLNTCQPTDQAAEHALTETPTTSYQTHNNEATNLPAAINGHIERYPGIKGSRPKHPDYALFSARQSSFSLWPENHEIDPAILSQAGFYFAGMGDCVRCFFCGGGMKNWEGEDNPWVEHARWFPDCEYVKLCKGNSFSNICNSAKLSDNAVINESQQHVENIPDDQTILDINCVAAKLVLAMGYTQHDVENGLMSARKKYGSSEMKAQYIIEFLQEINKEVPNKQQTVSGKPEITEHESNVASGGTSSNLYKTVNDVTVKDTNTRIKSEKQHLLEENRRLKALMTCKICLDKEAVVAFLPCGHLTSCEQCAKSLKKCAICRKDVAATVRVYQA